MIMKYHDKVAGTTFKKKVELQAYGPSEMKGRVQVVKANAKLVPEPENKFDENAIAVYAEMSNKTWRAIGYVAKDSDIYNGLSGEAPASLTILDYGDTNRSYQIDVDEQYIDANKLDTDVDLDLSGLDMDGVEL